MNSSDRLRGIGKDILIIVFAFLVFAFIDIRLAVLVGTVCTAVLLIRRFAFDLNPLSAKRKITYEGQELTIPEKVEIFELKDSASFESLFKYSNILQSIAIPPRVLIIRFELISYIRKDECYFLSETISTLNKRGIVILLADVNESILGDLKREDIFSNFSEKNVFQNLIMALNKVREIISYK